MKAGWEIKSLGEIADIQSGSGFPEKYQGISNHNIPFYKVSDMNLVGNEREMIFQNNTISELVRTQLGASIFPEGSTIFPKIGGAIFTNKKRITSKDSCVDNNVMGAIPKKNKVDSQFLYYFFQSHDLVEFANDAHLPSIRKTVVESWPIKIPLSITEQQRIVALLDQTFEGITKARENAEQNLQNVRALFESHLQSAFTQRGDVWVEKKLGEVVELDKTQHKPNNALPYVGMEDIESDTGNFIGSKEPRKVKSSTFHFNVSHVLYGRLRPYLNKVLLPDFEGHCSTEVFPLKPNSEVAREFLFYWVSLNSTKDKINATCTGARMPRANMNDVLTFEFFYPSLNVQNIIVQNLKELSKETRYLEALYQRKIALLDELKKSLLQQAFAGEL